MPIARSHGKARPELPRARDLQLVATAPERPAGRTADGRFGPGNASGRGRGWRRAIVAMLARDADGLTDAAANVARAAWHLYTASLKDLPASESPIVRSLAARRARHEALESYWSARAMASLGTDKGIAAEERANAHGQAATRLAVVLLDVASRIAAARPMPSWTPMPSASTSEADPHGGEDGPGTDEGDEDDARAVEEPERVLEPPARSAARGPSKGLCPHELNAGNCLECHHAREAAQRDAGVGGAPWRSVLPRGHRDWRPR